MADINVERKGPSIWPWIIGLIVLALLIWAIAEMVRTDDRTATTAPVAEETTPVATPAPTATAGAGALTASGQQFVNNCVQNGRQDMSMDHGFTANCLRQLAGAIEETAQQRQQQNANVQQHTQTMRQNADQLEQTPDASTQHANFVREAALAASTAMNQLHTANAQAPGQAHGQVERVRETAEAIRPGETLLNQRGEVNRFFDASRDALQQLAHAGHGTMGTGATGTGTGTMGTGTTGTGPAGTGTTGTGTAAGAGTGGY